MVEPWSSVRAASVPFANPVGHLPNDEIEMTEQAALERLAALSLLARFIDDADVEAAED